MASTIRDYWNTYLWRDAVLRLITVNIIVWIVVVVGTIVCASIGWDVRGWIGLFSVPADISRLPARFWTVFTYMFVQTDFLHLLVNMMWLMLFGRLFMEMQGPERLVTVYIYGGIAGAAGYIVYSAMAGAPYPMMYGASCSVLAICGAVGALSPDRRVNLMFFGPMKIIWLSAVAVLVFIFLGVSVDQSVAHASGLAIGIVFSLLRRKGIDITMPVINLYRYIDGFHRPVARNIRKDTFATDADHQEFDRLLQKVGNSGYNSLTPKERQRLFELSQKIKR